MKNKKKRIIVVSLSVIIPIICILYFVVFNPFNSQNKLQNENSSTFINKISSLEDGQEYRLSDVVPFEWDNMYVFSEYTDEAYIEKVIGTESSRIHISDSEGMQQVIFVRNKEVVGYIQGMDYKLGFSVERKGQEYLAIKNDDNYKLHVNMKDGIKYLEFKAMAQ